MNIKSQQHANEHSIDFHQYDTVVVSKSGSIYANCVVNDVCKSLEDQNEEFFIVKGERKKEVKKPETKD